MYKKAALASRLSTAASVLFLILACSKFRDAPNRELSDSELQELAAAPFDEARVMNKSFVVGRHRGTPVRIDFPCGDICPSYTAKVVRYDVDARSCPPDGEVSKLGVPRGPAIVMQEFCVPRVLRVAGARTSKP